MKKVINGKIYNTDTATRVANWDNNLPTNDFGYCNEDLYITSKGTYFVAGMGGALSIYAEAYGNGRASGSSIELLTKADALEWCEMRNIDADIIGKYFEISEG